MGYGQDFYSDGTAFDKDGFWVLLGRDAEMSAISWIGIAQTTSVDFICITLGHLLRKLANARLTDLVLQKLLVLENDAAVRLATRR